MLHHLFDLVIGHGQAQSARDFIELVAEANSHRCSLGAIYFARFTKRVVRSTNVPTTERLVALIMGSPFQTGRASGGFISE